MQFEVFDMPTVMFLEGSALPEILQIEENHPFICNDLREILSGGIFKMASAEYAQNKVRHVWMVCSDFTTWQAEEK